LKKIINPCAIGAAPLLKNIRSGFVDLLLSPLIFCAQVATALIVNLRTQATDMLLLDKAAWAWTQTQIAYHH
jgi:hypothetical protein